MTFILLALMPAAQIVAEGVPGSFGYLDFNSTLKMMPEYAEAQLRMQQIQADFDSEIERSKREFERKYVEFILEQDEMAPSIVAKRQKELQLLMDNNVQFRDKVQKDIENSRKELLAPIQQKLLTVIENVSNEYDLDYVIDTATHTYLFVNQRRGIDITNAVLVMLGVAVNDDELNTIEVAEGAQQPARQGQR